MVFETFVHFSYYMQISDVDDDNLAEKQSHILVASRLVSITLKTML